jgi:hypothetical protein
MANESERVMYLTASDVERTLDRAVEGLVALDVELLVPLALLCREWESRSPGLAIPAATQARLSWKLLLLDRLLRQTRLNLNVLGLEPVHCSPVETYRTFGRL